MRMIEVRCCCVPQKLLGWLPLERELPAGAVASYVIPPRAHAFAGGGHSIERAQTIALPVALFQTSQIVDLDVPGVAGFELEVDSHLALKSEETPLELLRRIPGFVENVAGLTS